LVIAGRSASRAASASVDLNSATLDELESVPGISPELAAAARAGGTGPIRIFGSVARGDDALGSDVDLLVELGPGRTLIDLIGFKHDAERILGQPVDVATPSLMKPRVRRRALRDARPL